MDDLAIGRLFRALRLRLGWRQADVAAKADISRSGYSEIERGHLDLVKVSTLRKVAGVLEVRLTLDAGWLAGWDASSVCSPAATLRWPSASRACSSMLAGRSGRRPRSAITAKRGVVDIAWHGAFRTLLLIEIKTELVDVNGLLEATDRRRRLAAVIARDSGWEPAAVAQWVVLAEGRTNERRVAEYRALLRAAFPADGRAIEGWLKEPSSRLDALWFLPDVGERSTGRAARGPSRVPTRRSNEV
jgi:transcriptional regulator with XRE-family HTH domain